MRPSKHLSDSDPPDKRP